MVRAELIQKPFLTLSPRLPKHHGGRACEPRTESFSRNGGAVFAAAVRSIVDPHFDAVCACVCVCRLAADQRSHGPELHTRKGSADDDPVSRKFIRSVDAVSCEHAMYNCQWFFFVCVCVVCVFSWCVYMD